jgi:hypothetical protein
MKIAQLEGTPRLFVIDQTGVTEITNQVEAFPLEDFYKYGWLVRPESWADRKARELREGFEAMSIIQLEEHLSLLSKFSNEYRVGHDVLSKKVEQYDREQLADAAESNAAKAKGLDGTQVPARRLEAANLSALPVGRILSGR